MWKRTGIKRAIVSLGALGLSVGAFAAPINKANDPSWLVTRPEALERKLSKLDAQGLLSGKAAQAPWSGSYLPYAKGGAGARMHDPKFPDTWNWQENFDYVERLPASGIVSSGDTAAIDRLSPAEKYDLLVGDGSYTLTENMWNRGQALLETQESVAAWIGFNHGSSAAATRIAEPRHTVTLVSPKGLRVRFYPDDIKALATILWANGINGSRLVGLRCNKSGMQMLEDEKLDQRDACWDVNPATLHLVLTNELGRDGNSFVADSSRHVEVHNAAIRDYSYEYFRPGTDKIAASLSEALIPIGEFDADEFAVHRSESAAELVGVEMTVTYADNDNAGPGHRVAYRYDLEIDEAGNVIGGEWHDSARPDFLWRTTSATTKSVVDKSIDPKVWDPARPVPAQWRKLAPRASHEGQPIAAIVEKLVTLSK